VNSQFRTELPPARVTRQRRAIVEQLWSGEGFVSAQRLHEALNDGGHRVGRSTVYRMLRELEEAEALDVIRDERGERLYRARCTPEHRHYLICRACSRSIAVDAMEVERWVDALVGSTGFQGVEHILELTGTCPDCLHQPARRRTQLDGRLLPGIELRNSGVPSPGRDLHALR
jgi:Fur family ferric uptake transcriptional regulator